MIDGRGINVWDIQDIINGMKGYHDVEEFYKD